MGQTYTEVPLFGGDVTGQAIISFILEGSEKSAIINIYETGTDADADPTKEIADEI